MKFPILSTIIIVAITAVLATLQGGRIQALQEERNTLETRAISLGLPLDGQQASKSDLAATAGKGAARATDGATASDHKAEAHAFAQELFAMVRKMKEFENSGTQPTVEQQKELMAFFLRFLELDPEVVPHLIAELRATDEFDDSDKRNIIGMSFMMLAQSSPRTALDLFVNSGDLIDRRRTKDIVGRALAQWAAEDPGAALEWIDLNESLLPEDSAEGARQLAIVGAFKSDPDLAVAMALKLDRGKLTELSQQVAAMSGGPENQLDLLRGLDGKLGELPSDPTEIDQSFVETASKDQLLRGGLLVGLGGTLARGSFEEASEFLEGAELGPVEMIAVAKGVADRAHSLDEPGSWLSWIDTHSVAHDREQNVRNVVRRWTDNDFRATAEWIGEQPDGPLRSNATHAFAETVAPHEPESAADWALTLPESPERTELLRNIHNHWQKKDEESAAAFAAQYGLGDRDQ